MKEILKLASPDNGIVEGEVIRGKEEVEIIGNNGYTYKLSNSDFLWLRRQTRITIAGSLPDIRDLKSVSFVTEN